MKCEYCGGIYWRANLREGMECSGCGAPKPKEPMSAPRVAMWSGKSWNAIEDSEVYVGGTFCAISGAGGGGYGKITIGRGGK